MTRPTRVLVTWGSKLGGTEGIADLIGETLADAGYAVDLMPAARVGDASVYDAAIIGGALYANRWHADARKLVEREVAALRRIPVWLFSSGPLDDSADRGELPMVSQVATLAERIGAVEHVTFGGRLDSDAGGLAGAMARTCARDWRNPVRIRVWATAIANALPTARPLPAVDHTIAQRWRALRFGVGGWTALTLALAGLVRVAPHGAALAIHAVLVVSVFAVLAAKYFAPRGASSPSRVGIAWGLLGAVTALVPPATWWAALPAGLALVTTVTVGFIMSTRPWPQRTTRTAEPSNLPARKSSSARLASSRA